MRVVTHHVQIQHVRLISNGHSSLQLAKLLVMTLVGPAKQIASRTSLFGVILLYAS